MHLRAGGDDALQRAGDVDALQFPVFLFQRVEAEGAVDHEGQHRRIDRLLVKIVGPRTDALGRVELPVVAGDDDDFGLRRDGKDLVKGREAFADPSGIRRQTQVQGDHRRLMALHRSHRRFPVVRHHHPVLIEAPPQLVLQAGIVFDDQQGLVDQADLTSCVAKLALGSLTPGMKKLNSEPWPGWLFTDNSPPRERIYSRLS